MEASKYSVNQHDIGTVLSWIKAGEIAIPEIQRPFVWSATKVRDLMDSLYNGYPVGYLIAWRNPHVKLKDGSLSAGKKILIDGQQRVTALRAALLGEQVVDKDYSRHFIKIAFNPMDNDGRGRFEVQNPAILKDKQWLPDIADLYKSSKSIITLHKEYTAANPECNADQVEAALSKLQSIAQKPLGFIELAHDLSIETVTEIFIRINSQGVVLSQADFAMSKIASHEEYDGINLRKAIDFFCHLAKAPEYYPTIRDNDPEFAKSSYFAAMQWLKDDSSSIYDPSYVDMLRVAFGSQFQRAKLADLVSLLSGRNFATRSFEDEVAAQSFEKLKVGVLQFMNRTNFERFVMIVKSAGFIQPDMIRSGNAINFAYILFLMLRERKYAPHDIERYVRRWLVLMLLTQRSSGSFESQFDYDIKQIAQTSDFGQYLADTEAEVLSDTYWDVTLVRSLETSVVSSPYLQLFLASQVRGECKGFLSRDIKLRDLLDHRGDLHHLFPKQYLQDKGHSRGMYNQLANFAFMQSEINIKIGKKSPQQYFAVLHEQTNSGKLKLGGIDTASQLKANLKQHCIPAGTENATADNYEWFLQERRKLMARAIKAYYFGL